MNEKSTNIEIFRHPIKKGTTIQSPSGENIALPVEGLKQAQRKASEFAEQFLTAPDGTVCWSLNSTAPRTKEAREIFDEELRVMAQKIGDGFAVIDLGGKMPSQETKRAVDNNGKPKKIVLINGPEDARLGAYPYDEVGYMRIADEIGEGNLISRWQTDPSISQAIGVSYPEVVAGFSELARNISDISKQVFPGRDVWVPAFSHSGETEVALATWSGNTTEAVIDANYGDIIGFLDSGHLEIRENGSYSVSYQGVDLSV